MRPIDTETSTKDSSQMSFFRRAWLHTSRKLVKSLTIFLVLLIASTLLLSTFAVRESAANAGDDLSSKLLSGFMLENNRMTNLGTARGGGTVTRAQIDAIAQLPGVESYVATMNSAVADVVNAEIFRLPGQAEDYSRTEEEKYGNAVPMNAVSRSDLSTAFRAGIFTLTKGRHLTEKDHHKILVHEEFAAKNHLKIGDSLTFKANEYDAENRFHSTASVDTEIVGMFSGQGSPSATLRTELYQNAVFTDLDTGRTINGTNPETEYYHEAIFFVKSVGDLDSVMQEAQKLPFDWEKYLLHKNSQLFGGIGAALEGIHSLLRATFIGTALFAVAALALVLFLWLNERRKETGILLATGVSKLKIFAQYVTENVMIFVLALAASFGTSKLVAQALGNNIVSRASAEAAERGRGGYNLGADFTTSTFQKTIDHVDVTVDPSYLVTVGIAGLVLIVIATLIASLPMLTKEPKQLLTQIG